MSTGVHAAGAAGFEQGGGIIVLQVRVTDRFGEETGAAAKDEMRGVRNVCDGVALREVRQEGILIKAAELGDGFQQGKGVGLLQVLADAGRQSRRQLELVVEGNVPVLFPRGAGRQGAARGFQQAQQRVCLRRAELFYLEKFDSLDQLEKAIVEYIDYYNNRRIKLKLNGLSGCQNYRAFGVTMIRYL